MTVNIDWSQLSFNLTPAKMMYQATTDTSGQWPSGEFVPYGPVSLSPAAAVLNYGQGVFEGLKAHRQTNQQIVLFRPDESARRFAMGAERLCLAPVAIADFVEVVTKLVALNHEYVPPCGMGSLYIRPCLWGTTGVLGVKAAPETTWLVFVSPVGNYFGQSQEIAAIKLVVNHDYHYSAPKGLGGIKFIGNYAGTILPNRQAKAAGFNGCVYLDPCDSQYVQETGAAHLFCIKGRQLFTPPLTSAILTGVTRDSVLTLARDYLNLEVIEAPLRLDSLLEADECFCSGTAAVITPVGSITHEQQETIFNQFIPGPYTKQLYELLTRIHQGLEPGPDGWIYPVQLSPSETAAT